MCPPAAPHSPQPTPVSGGGSLGPRQSQRLLRLSGHWYWRCDTDGVVRPLQIGVDGGALAGRGMGVQMPTDKPLWELALSPSDPAMKQLRDDFEARRALRPVEFRLFRRALSRDTPWIWVQVCGEPIFNDEGGFMGYHGLAQDVTVRRYAQDRLWDLSNLDPLTDLPNRARFHDELTTLLRSTGQVQAPFALATIDIDAFKEINDALGHDRGDALIIAVSERLTGVLGDSDFLARLGADEFGLMLHDLDSGAQLSRKLDALMGAMSNPISLGGQLRRCTLSMGVTMYPADATDPLELIKNADIALNRAKSAGRGQYVVFHPQLKQDVDAVAKIAQALELAVQAGQVLLHYQPVVDIASQQIAYFEALLRWCHPERGWISIGLHPQVWDNLGLGKQIGRNVMRLAAAQAAQWRSQGVAFKKIALNVTAADFLLGNYAQELKDVLDEFKLPIQALGVEVTEGLFLGRRAVSVLDSVKALHDMGIEISFDDFGTGFASLTHLKLPIDRIKIDRSFVIDIEQDTPSAKANAAIVRAVAAMGRDMGRSITVEGVETARQLERLVAMGCTQFQGYYFSKPLAAEQVPEFIHSLANSWNSDSAAQRR